MKEQVRLLTDEEIKWLREFRERMVAGTPL